MSSNNININCNMNEKQHEDSDKQSISTKMPIATKAASFTIPVNRPMFSDNATKSYLNLLTFTPDFISHLLHDHITVLEDGESFVLQHDSHYTLVTERSKKYMLNRHCPAGGKLVACSARKPGSTVFMESLHEYNSEQFPCMYHCNITKYFPNDGHKVESRNIHFSRNPEHEFHSFLTIQNSKKALLLTECSGQYLLELINIQNDNRVKNPKHISNLKANSFQFSMKSAEEEQQERDIHQTEYIIAEPERKLRKQFSMKEGQKFLKMINSEFGDAVLLITNKQIYAVEFEPDTIVLMELKVLEKLGKRVNQDLEKDLIKDASYIIDGLKIIFGTENSYVGMMEAENIICAASMSQITNKNEKCNIKAIHPLIGRLVVEEEDKKVMVIKIQDKVKLTFDKRIELPVGFPELQSYRFKVIPKSDEVMLQLITKREATVNLEIQKKTLFSSGNDFVPLFSTLFRAPLKKQLGPLKIASSSVNGIVCSMQDHELTFSRIFEGFSSEKNPLEQLFTQSFFEKPLGVSIDPFGSFVIVLFREFVKFFKFQYRKLVHFYTYNVRNVNYAGFTPSGEYILVSTEDMLYFINPYTFETCKAIEAYGDIKSIKFYESTLYMVLRNKINKNDEGLMIQFYTESNGEYVRLEELKMDPTEALHTDRRFAIIASKASIKVYETSNELEGEEEKSRSRWDEKDKKVVKLFAEKSIKLEDYYDYPTCINLCEELGVLLVGTAMGKIYQYLWPFFSNQDSDHFHVTHCCTSPINTIKFSTSYEKLYAFSDNKSFFQFQITQYVESQEMTNIYIMNSKSLYDSKTTKLRFASREYLYPNHTTYVYQDIISNDEVIEELMFVQEKIQNDMEEYMTKKTAEYEKEIAAMNQQKAKDVSLIKDNVKELEGKFSQENGNVEETLKINQESHMEKIEKFKDEYEKTLLDLYKQAARLKKIYADLEREHTKQKDIFLLQNEAIMIKSRSEGEEKEKQFLEKYKDIFQKADNYSTFVKLEKQEWGSELEEYKKHRHIYVQSQLETEENRKEGLLGSIGNFSKEITNYKQRKDEFESLIMETELQIEELVRDREEYEKKKGFLEKELKEKEGLIEEKESELILYVKNTDHMKKVKNTHQFELDEYEKEFDPISTKITKIEDNIRKMNGEILQEYLSKTQKEKEINDCHSQRIKMQRLRADSVKRKQISHTKMVRFLAQLNYILENPLDTDIVRKLNDVVNGEKYEINEDAIQQKAANVKLVRKKDFIRKEIEEREKREQQIVRNKNQFYKHYNENTVLVREFNELSQFNKALEQKVNLYLSQLEVLQTKIEKVKKLNKTVLETPKRKKSASMLEFKKFSQKKLTPFQRHEHEYQEMFNKGSTTETRITNSGQSLGLLKTLIKDVEHTDSKYEKMEIVRDRIRSYVNPEIRIRKAMHAQKVLFDGVPGRYGQGMASHN